MPVKLGRSRSNAKIFVFIDKQIDYLRDLFMDTFEGRPIFNVLRVRRAFGCVGSELRYIEWSKRAGHIAIAESEARGTRQQGLSH